MLELRLRQVKQSKFTEAIKHDSLTCCIPILFFQKLKVTYQIDSFYKHELVLELQTAFTCQ